MIKNSVNMFRYTLSEEAYSRRDLLMKNKSCLYLHRTVEEIFSTGQNTLGHH